MTEPNDPSVDTPDEASSVPTESTPAADEAAAATPVADAVVDAVADPVAEAVATEDLAEPAEGLVSGDAPVESGAVESAATLTEAEAMAGADAPPQEDGDFFEAPPPDDGDFYDSGEQDSGALGVADVGYSPPAGAGLAQLASDMAELGIAGGAPSLADGVDDEGGLPQAPRSERSVLATALANADAFALVADKLQTNDFFDGRNRAIYAAMLRLWQAHAQGGNASATFAFDGASVYQEVKRAGELSKLGGYGAINRLSTTAGSIHTIEHHAKLVKGQATVRRLMQTAAKIQSQAAEMAADPDAVVDMAQKQLSDLLNDAVEADYKTISEVLPGVIQSAKEARIHGKTTVGISYGYDRLNKMTSGMHRTNLLILAARPAMGKTALALNMALNVARQKVPNGERSGQPCNVMFFSLEMGADELVQRLLALQSGVGIQKLREGGFDDHDQQDIDRAAATLHDCQIFIDDTPGASTVDVRARATRVAQRAGGIDLIVIDYLQLMKGTGGNRQSRQEEVSEISRSLKGLAKELDCTVMALSQLNRQLESRQDKRPMMSDLRESGAIEQDADMIMFVYREHRYNKKAPETAAELIIGKHRAGELGTVHMHFDGPLTRFTETSVRTDDANMGGFGASLGGPPGR